MPDGQSGVLESLNDEVNAERAALVAPIPYAPDYERPSYVLENRKWGSTNFGTNGGTIRWAIIGPDTIYPSQEYTPAATAIDPVFHASIRAAFDRWEQVGNFDFVESYAGLADIVVIWDELSGQGSGTIGLANTYYIGAQIQHSYISFDIGRRYRLIDGTVLTVGTPQNSNTLNLYTLALHEIGHALGLDHEDDLPTIMGSYDNPAVTDLTADEIAGIEAIYGSKGSTAPTDDYSNTTATTGTVAVGGSTTGRIEFIGDSDWFRVSLTAGATYRIDVVAGTLADPFATLINSNGNSVATDDDSGTGLDARITYTPTTSGTYYIAARSAVSAGTGTYTVNLTQTATADDYVATTATTGVVTTISPTTAVINSASDRDWFRLSLSAGTTYTIRMAAGAGSTITDPAMYLLNSTGALLSGSNGSGGPLITFTPTTTGTYYIDAISRAGTGAYSVTMTSAVSDDFSASTATTGTFTTAGTTNFRVGTIESAGDRDWFRVSLTAGVAYQFDVQGAERAGYSLPNAHVILRDVAGTALASDDDSGTGASALLYYRPTTSGTYFVDAGATGTGTGIYYVSYASGVTIPDDYTASSATTGTVTVGGAVTGAIENANDVDWFRITLAAGQTYNIAMTGALTSPYVSVMDAASIVVANDANTGETADGRLTFTAPIAGTYYIGARSSGTATGSYTISVAAADEFAADSSTTGVVASGASLTGSIGQGADVDWVRVSLTGGTLYRFDARGVGSVGGTLADPTLSLVYSDGSVIRADNDSGVGSDSRVFYTPLLSGPYYLAVRATSSTATGTYTIAATANPDDYAASMATTGSVAVGGTAEGVIETAGDRDWLRATLTAGTTYTARLTGTATGSALRWTESSLVLRDSSGNQVTAATSTGLGASASLTFTAASSGTYYLDTLAYGAGVGAYAVSLTTGSALTESPAIVEDGLSAADLAVLMAPPAIALDEPPLQLVRSTTILVEDPSSTNPLSAIFNPPPPDLFTPPAEPQNRFAANTPFDQLFHQQYSNSYNLLPF